MFVDYACDVVHISLSGVVGLRGAGQLKSKQLSEVARRLREAESNPKTLTAKLMSLLPFIERLLADGHGYGEIVGRLHGAGLMFNDASFRNSLYRARRKIAKLRANRVPIPQPLEDGMESGSVLEPAESFMPAVIGPAVVESPEVGRGASDEALSNSDLASMLVANARSRSQGREFQFSSKPVPKSERKG